MTESELLDHILGRLSRAAGAELFSADEVRLWPEGAHAALIKAGALQRAQPAQVIECDGGERNCFVQVHVRQAEGARPAQAFISCCKPEVGRIPVDLSRLEQWQASSDVPAAVMVEALGCPIPPEAAVTQTSRHARRDAEIRAKYSELAQLGRRNYVKQIQRAVRGAELLSDRRIRDIVKGR